MAPGPIQTGEPFPVRSIVCLVTFINVVPSISRTSPSRKKNTKGVILGRGHLDLNGVFKALKKIGFPADGALSLEYEENPENPMDDIRACLQVAAESAQRVARG